jgi:cell division transport system permease protein
VEYYFRRALDGIHSSPAASGVAVASVAAGVLFAGAVLLVSSNAYRALARWAASAVDVSVHFRLDATEADVVAARDGIAASSLVLDSRYISREEAWQFLADNLDRSAELLAGLSPAILPASIEARIDRRTRDDELGAILARWRAMSGVSDVQATRTAPVSGTDTLDIVRWVAWALGALTLVASVAIVLTTYQLAAYTRREEMDVLRLVGAVGTGYWGPVVLAGVLEGVVASLLALVLLFGVFQAVAVPIRADLPAAAEVLAFLGLRQCLTLLVWGAALGGVGSAVGMWRVSGWR